MFRWIIILISVSFYELYGQSAVQALENGQDINVLYRNESAFKVFAHTRGFGASYRRGKHVTGKSKSLLEFDVLNLRHPKEVKVTGTLSQNKRFVFGKLNSVALLRAGAGLQNTLFSRPDKKAIEIRCSYILGATLALTKPYYVVIYKGSGYERRAYSVKYDAETVYQNDIAGRGPFLDGVNEIKLYPGLHAKANISFDYADFSNRLKIIETGVVCDYFPKALPIMAKNKAENFIVTLYVGFAFGKKWF